MKINWKPETDKSHKNVNVLCFNPRTDKMRVGTILPNTKDMYWTILPEPPTTTTIKQSKSQLDRSTKKTRRELKALELKEQGKTYKEIGQLLTVHTTGQEYMYFMQNGDECKKRNIQSKHISKISWALIHCDFPADTQ